MSNTTLLNKIENYLFRRNGKYIVVGFSAAIIHFVYMLFFQRIGNFSMLIYNVFSIAGYILFSLEAYKGNKITRFLVFAVFEIPISATLSTLYVGWDFRFMLVVTSATNMVFYVILFIDNFKHKIIVPTLIGFEYLALYIIVRIYTNLNPIITTGIKNIENYKLFFIYFNTVISFLTIILFNVLNAIEYAYIKNRLMSENNKLDTYATFDPLTNLLNRRSIDTQLKIYFDRHYHDEDAFSVILCDIDKFKSVNDTYGHDTGDYVLKEVAWILKDTVRDGDLVGRWGGEEFLIIVNSNKVNAAVLAERIRNQVEAHTYTYKNIDLKVTLTLGVSSYNANTDIDSLIKSADQKLYRGKENGRNQVVA